MTTPKTTDQFPKAKYEITALHAALLAREKEVSFSDDTIAGSQFVLGPGKLTIIGAPPGAGKSALAMQIAFEVLQHNDELSLVVANAEMDFRSLLKREVARRSGVSHSRILRASYNDDELALIDKVCADLFDECGRRCRHMQVPFTASELDALSLHEPGLLVVDYLQRFRASGTESRSGVDDVVNCLKDLATQGWAVLALSATTRQQGKDGGHDPSKLGLSSFKESSEIEFTADAAYVLRNKSDRHDEVKDIDLDCVKNRSGQSTLLELRFSGELMRFERNEPEIYEEFEEYAQGSDEKPW